MVEFFDRRTSFAATLTKDFMTPFFRANSIRVQDHRSERWRLPTPSPLSVATLDFEATAVHSVIVGASRALADAFVGAHVLAAGRIEIAGAVSPETALQQGVLGCVPREHPMLPKSTPLELVTQAAKLAGLGSDAALGALRAIGIEAEARKQVRALHPAFVRASLFAAALATGAKGFVFHGIVPEYLNAQWDAKSIDWLHAQVASAFAAFPWIAFVPNVSSSPVLSDADIVFLCGDALVSRGTLSEHHARAEHYLVETAGPSASLRAAIAAAELTITAGEGEEEAADRFTTISKAAYLQIFALAEASGVVIVRLTPQLQGGSKLPMRSV
jgi:hypothetical protein